MYYQDYKFLKINPFTIGHKKTARRRLLYFVQHNISVS